MHVRDVSDVRWKNYFALLSRVCNVIWHQTKDELVTCYVLVLKSHWTHAWVSLRTSPPPSDADVDVAGRRCVGRV
uniref:Uncharacterized protein n=1 Tax=Pararge aegeria TaxID=116150 RepID=S4P5P0_9NEOP